MKVSLVGLITLLAILQSCKKLDETNPEAVLSKYMELRIEEEFKAAYDLISTDSKKSATLGEYTKYFEIPDSLKPQGRLIKSIAAVDENINSPSYRRFKVNGIQISHKGDSIKYLTYFTLKNEDARWRIVWDNIITQQADHSFNNGDYDGALDLLETAIKLDPYDAEAIEKIGWCYLRDNTKSDVVRKDEIMKNFKYALTLEPDEWTHYNAMASYYSLINLSDLQIDSYNKGLEMALNEPDKATIYANLSNCYVAKRQTDKAIDYLEKSIECYPNSAYSYYKFGVILNDLGKYEEAKEKYEKALSLPTLENSLQSGLFYSYSSLCLKQYEYQKAKDYILKALEIDPNNEYYQALYDKINNAN
ncbi:MAG: tetratricopeptide repeat protein [Bacteroidetes bacterium]|nr:tetratricopeptide repeat protein [Bacteroidota bacterium]